MEKLKEIIRLSGRTQKGIFGLVVVGIIAGLCSFTFIALVNNVIQLLMTGELTAFDGQLFLYFAAVISVYIFCRRFLSEQIIVLSQNVFWNIRKEIIQMGIQSDFLKMQESKDKIYSTLTSDAGNITGASLGVIDVLTSTIMILACFVYMTFISPILFGISLLVIAVGVGIYQLKIGKLNTLFNNSRDLENDFLRHFNATLHGNKEINIERRKGADIFSEKLIPVTELAYNNNKGAFVGYLNNQIIGQILFYSLITVIILFVGFAFNITYPVIISFVFVLLYVLGPIENIMATLPFISRAVVSANRLLELRDALRSEQVEKEKILSNQEDNLLLPFVNINIKNLEYTFQGTKNSFSVGPVNLEISKGEIVFVYGGNGSGKTTFLYTMLGLYDATAGQLVVNGETVTEEQMLFYKNLYAPVFSDFYLFEEFYSIDSVDEEKLKYYLELFEIDEKVTIENGKYSTIDLSTGQRKRLALIAALMEKKPILVLDEWAADQDPYFRKKFYTEILPLFKEAGITTIAITHDDKYYDYCDRLLQMEYGKLYEMKSSSDLIRLNKSA